MLDVEHVEGTTFSSLCLQIVLLFFLESYHFSDFPDDSQLGSMDPS